MIRWHAVKKWLLLFYYNSDNIRDWVTIISQSYHDLFNSKSYLQTHVKSQSVKHIYILTHNVFPIEHDAVSNKQTIIPKFNHPLKKIKIEI